MPAEAHGFGRIGPGERLTAIAAVSVIQFGLALALLIGLRVQISRPADVVERLVEVALPKPPPPPVPIQQPQPRTKAARQPSSAPKAEPDKIGGSPGPATRAGAANRFADRDDTALRASIWRRNGSWTGARQRLRAGEPEAMAMAIQAKARGAPTSNRSPATYRRPIIRAAFAKTGLAGASSSPSRSAPTAE